METPLSYLIFHIAFVLFPQISKNFAQYFL